MKPMRQEFVDRQCRALPGAERFTPFGDGTVVWKVNGHMFAAYTDVGAGLSVRTADMVHALAVIRQNRTGPSSCLTGGNWVVLPWEAGFEELRLRLIESYTLVRRDWPQAAPDPASARAPRDPASARSRREA